MASPTARHLIRFLLRLYPRGWRARYSDEFASILADAALTPAIVLDVVLGALDARWSGEYPAVEGDDRKVRRPMNHRLPALLVAAGGAFWAAFLVVYAVAMPPDGSAVLTAWYIGIPIAMAALSLGIAGLSLDWLGNDPLGRALGIMASLFAAGIALAVAYLFVAGDLGYDIANLLLPGLALTTALAGARIVVATGERLAGIVLLATGGAALALGLASLVAPDVLLVFNIIGFAALPMAWGFVGLLRIRPQRVASATA